MICSNLEEIFQYQFAKGRFRCAVVLIQPPCNTTNFWCSGFVAWNLTLHFYLFFAKFKFWKIWMLSFINIKVGAYIYTYLLATPVQTSAADVWMLMFEHRCLNRYKSFKFQTSSFKRGDVWLHADFWVHIGLPSSVADGADVWTLMNEHSNMGVFKHRSAPIIELWLSAKPRRCKSFSACWGANE